MRTRPNVAVYIYTTILRVCTLYYTVRVCRPSSRGYCERPPGGARRPHRNGATRHKANLRHGRDTGTYAGGRLHRQLNGHPIVLFRTLPPRTHYRGALFSSDSNLKSDPFFPLDRFPASPLSLAHPDYNSCIVIIY